jgi:hypothetical protein
MCNMKNIPNQTTNSDDNNAPTYEELKEEKDRAVSQTFDLFDNLAEMKGYLAALMSERDTKQDIKDFVEDHVFAQIDLLWKGRKTPIAPTANAENLLECSPPWAAFKKSVERAIIKYPTWRTSQTGAVNITNRLKPWLKETLGFNDREASIVVKLLKDIYPSDFP